MRPPPMFAFDSVAGAAKPRRLGRGLSSLLAEPVAVSVTPVAGTPPAMEPSAGPVTEATPAAHEREVGGPRVQLISVTEVGPSPFQPRRTFDQGALERLATSIRSAGVMQPVLVRRGASGRSAAYELIAGERRWRAAQLAGLGEIPAILASISDEQAAEWALIENLQREELGPMERAYGLRSLVERFSLTHAQVADRVGLDRSSVTNLIRLTELEEPIRTLLDDRRLSVGHGKALLSVPPGPARSSLAERAAAHQWSVRQLERAATAAANAPTGALSPSVAGKPSRVLAQQELERQLGEFLGTKVVVRTNKSGTSGRMVIQFFDLDHFDGLMSKIGFVLK